ncbi:hypothetical protein MTsDn1_09240 [Alteromonas sp. MTD1]|uniref:hypothetical protein n=1 Tax=Alteromonas sp. MTD1 TaxID=3057962 RepID=UPI0036F30053
MNEHGSFTLRFVNDVIYLKMIGPWNAETFRHYNSDLTDMLEQSGSSSFSGYVVLEGDSLMMPEVYDNFRIASVQRVGTGLKNVAFLIRNSQCPLLVQEQIASLYKDLPINYRFFELKNSAITWLQSLNVGLNNALVDSIEGYL